MKEVIMMNPLGTLRVELSIQIGQLQAMADERPENGAELMLAIRHLQDARMRLGVAMTIEKGEDPWSN